MGRWHAALLVVCGLCVLLMWNRLLERLIFVPTPGVDLRPEALGLEAEELSLKTEDRVRLHAFFLPTGASRALLFLHGNAGNASHRLPNAARLAALGIDVLLPDYRGYGLSEGRPSESGVYADARAALSYLTRQRRLPEDRIVLFGRSLGAAVAVELAQGRALAGVILESPFPSASAVARTLLGPLGAWIARGRFESDRKIPSLRSPLLFFHGDRDEIIDLALGERLFRLAPEPKAFEVLQGAGHNDTVEVGGPAYFARIGRFLDRVAPP